MTKHNAALVLAARIAQNADDYHEVGNYSKFTHAAFALWDEVNVSGLRAEVIAALNDMRGAA